MVVSRPCRLRTAAPFLALVAAFGCAAVVDAEDSAGSPPAGPAVAVAEPAPVPAAVPLAGSAPVAATSFIAASGPVAVNSDGLTAASGPVAVPSGSPPGPVIGSQPPAVVP